MRRFSAAFFGLLFLVFLSQKEESEKRRKSAALQNSFRFELLHHHLRHSSALVIALPPLRRQVIGVRSATILEIMTWLGTILAAASRVGKVVATHVIPRPHSDVD